MQHNPSHLRYVATLPSEIKNQIFCRYSADMEENANKLHFKKLPTFDILCYVPLQMQTSYQNLVLVAEYQVDC